MTTKTPTTNPIPADMTADENPDAGRSVVELRELA